MGHDPYAGIATSYHVTDPNDYETVYWKDLAGDLHSTLKRKVKPLNLGTAQPGANSVPASAGRTGGASRNGGSSRWLGYLQNVQRYNTRNDLGQTVVNAANLLNADGTAHAAYKAAPGTRLGNLMMRQQRGEELTDAERRELFEYWRTNPTRGLFSVDALGTRRGGIGRRGASAPGKAGNARGYN